MDRQNFPVSQLRCGRPLGAVSSPEVKGGLRIVLTASWLLLVLPAVVRRGQRDQPPPGRRGPGRGGLLLLHSPLPVGVVQLARPGPGSAGGRRPLPSLPPPRLLPPPVPAPVSPPQAEAPLISHYQQVINN